MDVNGVVASQVARVLSLLDLPWPGGDPAALRRLAGEWRALAGELADTAQRLDGQVEQVVGSCWTGAAAEAFVAHWRPQHRALVVGARSFRKVAAELDAYADQAEQLIRAIVELALQIAEFELAGAFLTVLTGGLSDAVAAAASGPRALELVRLVARFAAMAERAERVITELIEEIRSLGVLPRILVDSLKNVAANLAGAQLGRLTSGKGAIGESEATTAAVSGVGAAGLSGVAFGIGQGMDAGGRAARWLTGEGLSGGEAFAQSVVSGGLTGAAGAAVADGVERDDARTAGADTLTAAVAGAVGAGEAWTRKGIGGARGRHAEPLTPITQDLGANTGATGAGCALADGLGQDPAPPAQDPDQDQDQVRAPAPDPGSGRRQDPNRERKRKPGTDRAVVPSRVRVASARGGS